MTKTEVDDRHLEGVVADAARARVAVAVAVEGQQPVDAPPVCLQPRRLVAPQRLLFIFLY